MKTVADMINFLANFPTDMKVEFQFPEYEEVRTIWGAEVYSNIVKNAEVETSVKNGDCLVFRLSH